MRRRIGVWGLRLGATLFGGCATDGGELCANGQEESVPCGDGHDEVGENSATLGFHPAKLVFTVSGSVDGEEGGTVTASSRSHRARCEGNTCEARLGSWVTLQASPAEQYRFLGWSGCSDSSETQITLRFIHRDQECVAHFAPDYVTVSAFVIGWYRAQVHISAPDRTCSSYSCSVPYGTPVTLEAPSSPSYRFISWGECSSSTEPTLVVSTEGPHRSINCLAIMEPITEEVSWSVAPGGGGTARLSGSGPDIVCGESSCQVVLGAGIGLMAEPDAGYRFTGWSDCSDSTEPHIRMDNVYEPRHCVAHFAALE
jgi:hypothetical protein